MTTLIEGLTDCQRIAWALFYRRGWTTRRIARHLGTTVRAVQYRLANARRRVGAPPARHPSGPRRRNVRAIPLHLAINV